jgi:hypothetical protein
MTAGCTLRAVLPLAGPGLILLFALAVEHWRYQPVTSRRPGPDMRVPPDPTRLIGVLRQPVLLTLAEISRFVYVRDPIAVRHVLKLA